MIIRKLTLNDFDEVNNIYMQLHDLHVNNRPDVYCKIDKPTTPDAWDYERSLDDNNKIMLGAEINGKIVGFAIILIRRPSNKVLVPRTFAHIDEIAVEETYRRKGVGKALYYESINCAKEKGATSVELKVWSFNEEAISFYKSLGMKVQNYTMELTI